MRWGVGGSEKRGGDGWVGLVEYQKNDSSVPSGEGIGHWF